MHPQALDKLDQEGINHVVDLSQALCGEVYVCIVVLNSNIPQIPPPLTRHYWPIPIEI